MFKLNPWSTQHARVVLLVACSYACSALAASPPAASVRPSGCSTPLRPGHWQSAGGNDWWVRCEGNEIFWLGMNRAEPNAPAGRAWSHVGYGTLTGKVIRLRWADIPLGTDTLAGAIEVTVVSETEMVVSKDHGVFGLSRWRWVGEH